MDLYNPPTLHKLTGRVAIISKNLSLTSTFISRFDRGSDQYSPEMEPKSSLAQSPVTEIPPGRSIN